MNIKDAYIHNGDAILKDIQLNGSKLQKLKAGKNADDTYLIWDDVVDLSPFGASGHNHDDRYLKLTGGTMGNTNVITNLNADLLDGYHASSLSKTVSINLAIGKVLRIDMSLVRGLLINAQGTNGGRNALYFVTGYGEGTTIRNDIRVIKGGPYNIYFNGTSEHGCVYIVGTSSATDSDLIYINPFDYNDITYTIVSSVPSDAVLVSPYNILATLNSNVASSSKWANARTITLTGSVTGSVSIDGSTNVSLDTTTNHTHTFDSLTDKPTFIRLFYDSGNNYVGARSDYGENMTGDKYLEWWNSAGWVHHKAGKFSVAGGTSSQFLKADGSLDSTAYLPLSGGTLSGSGAELLKLDSSHSSYNAILFKVGGVTKSEFGFTVGKCSYIYDYTSSKYLGVDVSGTPFYGAINGTGKYTLIHSGNFNSYSPKLDGTGAIGTWSISITGNAKTATTSTYTSNVGSSGTAGTNYVTAANVISMYNWYNSITATDDASNTAIDKWNEIVSFLAGITDTSTLSGILAGYAAAGHNHDDKYVKLDGSNVMSDDLTLNLGDLDRFIVFSYPNTVNPSHDSWRTGVLGTGHGENNFFVVQYQKVNTNSSDWNTVFKIGQDTGTVTFTNNIKVGSNTVYHSGNLPAYPTVNNGALYLQANGTTKVTFTANQSSNSTLNIATGSSNGTISVGGTNVSVKGLGSNAYSSTAYLPLAGGTMDDNAQIKRNGESSLWIYGRDNALIRETSSTGYHPLFSLKTTDGSWELGEYNLYGWNNIPVFSYITDENYNNGNNSATYQIQYPLASGTIALTADLTWSNISSKPETATRWPSWSEVTNKPSTFPADEHNHDGRYLRWNGSAADVSAMAWGTLTTANGYKILSHATSSDSGDWGMANQSGKIYMQLDGYYYQNEGQYRVTDVSETVTALGTNGNYLTWTKNGITNNITVPYADTLDGYHAYASQLYNVVKSLTVTTVNTIWYLKIMLSPYAQPDHMLVTCSYNNEIDQAHIYFSGMSGGYIYRNNNQNEGNIKAIALKSVYDATEHIWIFYLKFDKIYNSSEQHYSPSSSATVSVYTLDNYAFNIAIETTEPNGVTWVTTGHDDDNLIIKNAKLYGSATYADTAGSVAWDNVSDKPTFTTWSETSSVASYSLSNAAWTNTITLPTIAGSYILNIVSGNSTLTGVFSIGASDNAKDEISLHLHGNGPRLYARTNGTTLQLSSNDASATSRSVTIKYRRMI